MPLTSMRASLSVHTTQSLIISSCTSLTLQLAVLMDSLQLPIHTLYIWTAQLLQFYFCMRTLCQYHLMAVPYRPLFISLTFHVPSQWLAYIIPCTTPTPLNFIYSPSP